MFTPRRTVALALAVFAHAALGQSSFRLLTPTGSYSEGRAVSGNGLVVAGMALNESCFWNTNLVRTAIQRTGNPPPYATDTDADGNAFVTIGLAQGNNTSAFRVVLGLGAQRLPKTWNAANEYRISAAGDVVAGYFVVEDVASSSNRIISRWTATGGVQPLSGLSGLTGQSNDVSADGLMLVGQYSGPGNGQTAFKWTQAANASLLPDLTSGFWRDSSARAVNADGSVIVGSSKNASGVTTAVRWTAAGIQALGYLPGDTGSFANDVSENGKVIGGVSLRPSQPSLNSAFIWTECYGLETLQSYAARFGVSLSGYDFSIARLRFNADGSVMTGNCITPSGGNRGFVLTLRREMASQSTCPGGSATFTAPSDGLTGGTYQWRRNAQPLQESPGRFTGTSSPTLLISNAAVADSGTFDCIVTYPCGVLTSPAASLLVCPGDFNCNGAVDGDDVVTFFAQWDSGSPAADVNSDGAVDGDDVISWFSSWDAGC